MELLLRRCRARSRTASPAGLCLCLATATRCIAAFCLAAPAPLQELLGLAPLSSTSEGLASLRFSGAAGVGGVALLSSLVGEGAVEEGSADEELPTAEMECWRPTMDDVDRISRGKPARKKGTGSRGVPHRLNDAERMVYDMAHRKGFLEVGGSCWRTRRRGAAHSVPSMQGGNSLVGPGALLLPSW
ncbi:hypothetical protein T484DRAFT_2866810 [Baffinella frigidus]|nr:hypothetical protein T484DRAFT_2866810 [Cryptophyta sp. CCMP2293]